VPRIAKDEMGDLEKRNAIIKSVNGSGSSWVIIILLLFLSDHIMFGSKSLDQYPTHRVMGRSDLTHIK
jgi:hypothetical protein